MRIFCLSTTCSRRMILPDCDPPPPASCGPECDTRGGELWFCSCSWVVGLAPEAGRFFFYWLVTFLFHTFAVSIFRCEGLRLS